MPDLPLTKAGIEALPSPERVALDYRDTKQRGLWLRISPAGTKSWCVRYKAEGKSQRENIGRFPELPISLARERAVQVLTKIAGGTDPKAERAERRRVEERRALETVEAVGRRYLEEAVDGRHRHNGRPMRPSSLKLENDYFKNVLLPGLGSKKLSDLSRHDIQAFIRKVEEDRSPGAARHSRNVLQRIYAFAIWQDIVINDPIRFVSSPTWTERERVLTDAELAGLWSTLSASVTSDEVHISPAMAAAFKLAAVTLQRRGEVIGMSLDEIDRKARTWTLPGERTKNGRTHVVPLSDLALELIDFALAARAKGGANSVFVFPSPRTAEKPQGSNAMTHAWDRLKPHMLMTKNGRRVAIQDITLHDLRRTGATNITSERIGMPRFVVSQVLNHSSDAGGASAVTSVYDRNAYLKEKRAALDAWAALLTEIVSVPEPAEKQVTRSRPRPR